MPLVLMVLSSLKNLGISFSSTPILSFSIPAWLKIFASSEVFMRKHISIIYAFTWELISVFSLNRSSNFWRLWNIILPWSDIAMFGIFSTPFSNVISRNDSQSSFRLNFIPTLSNSAVHGIRWPSGFQSPLKDPWIHFSLFSGLLWWLQILWWQRCNMWIMGRLHSVWLCFFPGNKL